MAVRDMTNAVNVVVANNSFNKPSDSGIYFGGNIDAATKIINNIIKGIPATTVRGIWIVGTNSGVVDYNNVLNCANNWGGNASQGTYGISQDPLYVSDSDLQLQNNSPSLDAGASQATHSEVPSFDFLGNSRPVDQPHIVNVTGGDGTDQGAYEMGAFVAAEYYINPLGSNTPPYDTPEKGIPTLSGALAALSPNPGDEVIVDGDNGEIDDSAASLSVVPEGVIIKRKPGGAKPRLKIKNDGVLLRLSNKGAKVQDIDFYKAGPSASSYFIDNVDGADGEHEVSDCTFEVENPTGNAADGIKISDRVFTGTAPKFASNIFKNIRNAIHSMGGGATVDNVIIDNNRYFSCARGIWIQQAAVNVHVVNNSFYDVDRAIDFDSSLTTSNILNNAMDGQGGTTGIEVQNYVSGVVDYNIIHDYTTDINIVGGAVSAGPNNSTDDPLFVSPADLQLQSGSPAIDAAIRTGYENIVPTVDCTGLSRPQDNIVVVDADDGTDIGAFEMPASVIIPTQIRPLEIITLYNKFDRVTRSIVDLDNFQIDPGMWAVVTDDSKVDMVSDYSSGLCQMVINYVGSDFYETHDTRASRVTTVESIGVKFRINNSVYVGNPAVDELLTVSAEAGEEGKLKRIVSLPDGYYYAFAKVTRANAEQGWIECETLSPRLVQLGTPAPPP